VESTHIHTNGIARGKKQQGAIAVKEVAKKNRQRVKMSIRESGGEKQQIITALISFLIWTSALLALYFVNPLPLAVTFSCYFLFFARFVCLLVSSRLGINTLKIRRPHFRFSDAPSLSFSLFPLPFK